jgi:ankyrin repeat protein
MTCDGFTPIHLAANRHCFEVVKFLMDAGIDINQYTSSGATIFGTAVHNFSSEANLVAFLLDSDVPQVANAKGVTPLHEAAHHRNAPVVRALLESGGNCNVKDVRGLTPLHIAAKKSYYNICMILLDAGADTSLADIKGMTALHYACDAGVLDVVELLCDFGASPNAIDEARKTPLNHAFMKNRFEIIDYFADLGIFNLVSDSLDLTARRRKNRCWFRSIPIDA